MSGASGAERGRQAVLRLREEIDAREAAGETLPMNGRALHLAKICQLVGVGRSTVTQNPAFRAMLKDYAGRKGVAFSARGAPSSVRDRQATGAAEAPAGAGEEAMVPASRLREEQRRSAAAERRLSELVARNAALIARLRRYEATDRVLIAAGRRYRPGPPQHENSVPGQGRLELDETSE
ncbi:MAG: hypothetical protein OXB97_14035 [Rhodospirillales bacterium]|nr:hypothetical protein [Rhodospirillales bacterium]